MVHMAAAVSNWSATPRPPGCHLTCLIADVHHSDIIFSRGLISRGGTADSRMPPGSGRTDAYFQREGAAPVSDPTGRGGTSSCPGSPRSTRHAGRYPAAGEVGIVDARRTALGLVV